MKRYVLDTNIVSAAIRSRSAPSSMQLISAIRGGNLVLGCPIVWYEVKRGLLSKDAHGQEKYFDEMYKTFEWSDYTLADWSLATTLWAQRRSQGLPIGDADLLIAVFTLNRNAVLVTDNEKDFVNLGLQIENWML
jgi:predicted nucleic acid-binding protein